MAVTDRNSDIRAWVEQVKAAFPNARLAHFDGPGGAKGDAALEAIWDDPLPTGQPEAKSAQAG